jgi:lipopolysaccharide export system permease protein
MHILDRYISRTIIVSTLMVSAVIVGIQSFLAVVSQLQSVGVQHYTVWDALLSVPMELPSQYYQLFPMAGFLGAMIGLGKLSASSELIVMRSAGVSMKRIAWSVMKAAILMIIFMTWFGEGVGPLWQQHAEKMRYDDLSPTHTAVLLKSVWLHEGNTFTHIHHLENNNTMKGIVRYQFDGNGKLLQTSAAETGKNDGAGWQLNHLVYTHFEKGAVTTSRGEHSSLHVVFQPNLQVQMKTPSVEQTLSELYRTIQYRKTIGLGVNQFVYLFWQRLLQPLTTLVMISLAVPFVFGSYRSMSMSVRIITGVMFGFIFYMMNQLFGPITLVYQFPPFWAAVLPTFFFFFISMGLLLRAR